MADPTTSDDSTHSTPTDQPQPDHEHAAPHHGETTTQPVADRTATVAVDRARGGFSFGSVITGVLVAFGAFIILSAIIGALLTAVGLTESGINVTDARNATIGAGIALVVVQLAAYLWGGYTAGRMARGSGVLNGILVPLVALIFVAIVGAIVAAAIGDLQADSAQEQLPLPLSDLADIGTGIGIGLLVAMFLGGALGGFLGQRWHTKLENAERHPA